LAEIGKIAAFSVSILLLKETNRERIIREVCQKCYEQRNMHKEEMANFFKEIYKPFLKNKILNL